MHDSIPMQKPQALQYTPKHLFGDTYRNWFFVRFNDVIKIGSHEWKYQTQGTDLVLLVHEGIKGVKERNAITLLRFVDIFVDACMNF